MIEGSWGLGEYIVQGTVTPDLFWVAKQDLAIIERTVHEKPIQLIRRPGGGVLEQEVPEELRKVAVLSDDHIRQLAGYALDIEKHYGCFMDMEWALDERNEKLWILQARPETVWSNKVNKNQPPKHQQEEGVSMKREAETAPVERTVLVKGLPASPGRVSGIAHVILSPNLIDNFKEGEILVTEMTAPDWVPAMKKA